MLSYDIDDGVLIIVPQGRTSLLERVLRAGEDVVKLPGGDRVHAKVATRTAVVRSS